MNWYNWNYETRMTVINLLFVGVSVEEIATSLNLSVEAVQFEADNQAEIKKAKPFC